MTAFTVKKALPIISTLFALSASLLGAQAARAAPPYNPDRPFNAKSFGRTFTHRFASVNGVHLHYVIGGKGAIRFAAAPRTDAGAGYGGMTRRARRGSAGSPSSCLSGNVLRQTIQLFRIMKRSS